MMNDHSVSSAPENAMQLVVTFRNEEELLKSYRIMKEGSTEIYLPKKTFYSPPFTVFIDQFGVLWRFMAD